ncbi:MAG: alanine racemase [Ilumatobacteraceae bacterium]
MALRLTVQRAAWELHVRSLTAAVEGLVPVVKGNGYGFGRPTLHGIAATVSNFVCVGTVYELDAVAASVTPVVLTPTSVAPQSTDVVLTVGSCDDVAVLSGWAGRVLVKLQSSMRRYGATPAELAQVVSDARVAGLEIVGYSLHLPLAGSEADRLTEVETWLGHLDSLDDRQPLWLSHLQPHSYSALRHRHPSRELRLRVGTMLWHGDKSFLHLHADVLAIHPVRAGDRAGYQLNEVPSDGHLVVVGAGSAHGIAALPGGASPFHFNRTRLALLEPPHMHTSMMLASSGDPCPAVGDHVDVQRPLISTFVDEVEWV